MFSRFAIKNNHIELAKILAMVVYLTESYWNH
jgi:hypothetical protein